jgi:hypothetical protein
MQRLLLLFALLLPAAAQAEDGWEEISDEEGIKVWKKELEGSDFVMFRGRGPIEAGILDVAAVIRDADRETEWMADCVDARTLKFLSATDAIVYHRTGSPAFFVDDRDTVLVTRTKVIPEQKTILVTFDRTEDTHFAPVDGVVRMPQLKGHWRIRQIDIDTTEVEYQVQADPGGLLPAWLVNLVSKKLPFQTLMGLRSQVKKDGYDRHKMILEVAIDWTPFLMPPTAEEGISSKK